MPKKGLSYLILIIIFPSAPNDLKQYNYSMLNNMGQFNTVCFNYEVGWALA
jgi:hypothetical protein